MQDESAHHSSSLARQRVNDYTRRIALEKEFSADGKEFNYSHLLKLERHAIDLCLSLRMILVH